MSPFNCYGSAEKSVPMTKERCKVAAGFLVMHVMGHRPSKKPKRNQVARRIWQVVADMIFHRHPNAENSDGPHGQRMALEQDGIEVAPEAHRHQLHAAQVLGGPGERRDVIVMDGMDQSVQVRVFVVHHVPEEVLGVEDEQNAQPA